MGVDRVEPVANRSENGSPRGLGGWLILPLLGLGLTPVVCLIQFVSLIDFLEVWKFLQASQKLFVMIDLLASIAAFFVAPILLLILAFRHSEMFPGLYVIWAGAVPILVLLDAVIAYQVFRDLFADSGEEMFDRETIRSLGRSIWSAAIWIPYMMRSKRVENTFFK